MSLKYVQAQKFRLSGSGCTSSATSIIVIDFTLVDGTAIAITDFNSLVGFATLEPGTSKEESISFTGITANGDGTSTLTGVSRGLRFVSPYDVVVANKKAHAGGTIMVLSNSSAFYGYIQSYIDTALSSGGIPATTTLNGIGHVSVAPANAAAPIFVGDNDPRVPTQAENDALVGTGTPSSSNKYVTEDYISSASTTNKGLVEEAIASEVNLGTASGSAAKLFINPATPGSYGIGVGPSTVAKTYFNIQTPFILWIGSTSGALTTDFPMWERTSEVAVPAGGLQAIFQGTGSESITATAPFFYMNNNTGGFTFDNTKTIIMDWFAKWESASSGDVTMGWAPSGASGFTTAYNDSVVAHVAFTIRQSNSHLYAHTSRAGVGATTTDISSGLTLTNWNHYRIELTGGTNAKFYVNGVLLATNTTNLPTGGADISPGFGRSNTALFEVTAPNFAIQLI